MNRTTVRPRTMTRTSDDLACNVRRVYGYQAECQCGWKGDVWRTISWARAEASFHVCAA